MIADVNLFGVFLNGALVSAVIALLLLMPLRRLLVAIGAYRFIWHTGLFDIALFVIAWASVAAALTIWSSFLSVLLN